MINLATSILRMNLNREWRLYFSKTENRKAMGITLILAGIILPVIVPMLQWVQQRKGLELNDPVLSMLPAVDLSWPIFISMVGVVIYSLAIATIRPVLMIRLLAAYCCMQIFRTLMLILVPLDPPKGLIYLMDPLVHHTFYSGVNITRDLFFSGHAATVFLLYFALKRRIILLVAVLVSVMLLIQHIHYTIDILAAPFFSWLSIKCLPPKYFGELKKEPLEGAH